jgi:hypothetical protein
MMRAWIAHQDMRTGPQRREQIKRASQWWLGLGGEDVFAET